MAKFKLEDIDKHNGLEIYHEDIHPMLKHLSLSDIKLLIKKLHKKYPDNATEVSDIIYHYSNYDYKGLSEILFGGMISSDYYGEDIIKIYNADTGEKSTNIKKGNYSILENREAGKDDIQYVIFDHKQEKPLDGVKDVGIDKDHLNMIHSVDYGQLPKIIEIEIAQTFVNKRITHCIYTFNEKGLTKHDGAREIYFKDNFYAIRKEDRFEVYDYKHKLISDLFEPEGIGGYRPEDTEDKTYQYNSGIKFKCLDGSIVDVYSKEDLKNLKTEASEKKELSKLFGDAYNKNENEDGYGK